MALSPELMGLPRDHLFAWRWLRGVPVGEERLDGVIAAGADGGAGANRDGWTNASDADVNIAWALIQAERRFGPGHGYLDEARAILRDLWETNTFVVGGHTYLAANVHERGGCVAVGYLAPPAFRDFARVDPDRDWGALVTSTYALLRAVPSLSSEQTHLPPGWVAPTEDGLAFCPDRLDARVFGSDAFRILFWVGLDALLNRAPEALAYVAPGSAFGPYDFLRAQLDRADVVRGYSLAGRLPSMFELDGTLLDVERTAVGGHGGGAFRANAGQYGAYLTFFAAAGDQTALAAMQEPLVTLRGPDARAPAPWLSAGASGVWWSAFDGLREGHDDYYGGAWAWFGLAARAGLFGPVPGDG